MRCEAERSVTSKLISVFFAFVLGTLYAAFLGLITFPLRASLISWPIWIILFCCLFWKFKLAWISGFLAVLPLTILSAEVARSIRQPPEYAFQLISLDRSHYTPGARVLNQKYVAADSDHKESAVKELYIGADGFRADPETGRGNPAQCHEALIGDSMIYGSGLPYSDTLGPVLERMNVRACVFGVPGNSPVDYLATLSFVADRIDDGARLAIYVYVYNDFVSMRKYMERSVRGFSPLLTWLTRVVDYYDDWRRTTFVQGYLRGMSVTHAEPLRLFRLKLGDSREIKVYWPHDPAQYPGGPALKLEEKATFQFFLKRLREIVANRSWRVSIVFIPDNEEMLANLARPSASFQDMDPRRVEALKTCLALWSDCHDLTRYLYDRTIAAGQSPYLLQDRHFSVFGNQVLAEHFVTMGQVSLAHAR
jgi:hypothetical protein